MCWTVQWPVSQTESNRRPVPAEFFRFTGMVRDRQRSFRATGESGCLGGVISEPAPETILERVNLAWAKEEVITGLTVQTAVAGVRVRARVGEVGCVDQRGAGIGSQQDRSLLGRRPPGDGDSLAGLDNSPAHAGRAWQDTAVRLSPSAVVPASTIRSGNGTSAGIQVQLASCLGGEFGHGGEHAPRHATGHSWPGQPSRESPSPHAAGRCPVAAQSPPGRAP